MMAEKHKHEYGPVVGTKDGKKLTWEACRICGSKRPKKK